MYVNVAILKETRADERRVALVPSVTARLIKLGARLHMETGAGLAAKLPDSAYTDVAILPDRLAMVADADVVLAVQPPDGEVVTAMKPGAILICFVYAEKEADLVRRLLDRRITCFAMERVPRITRAQSMDALSSQSALAGYYAVQLGSTHLRRILPKLTTAAGAIGPARVLVMGLGVAGLEAMATAHRLGAVVEGYDVRPDPPKPTAHAAVARLKAAGIQLKILSGDDPVVVGRLAGLVGLATATVLSGANLAKLSDDALAVQVRTIDAYGRLAPDQKARLIRALQAGGAVVGYLGDGINDAPALKLADIGLSVEGAASVAQASADMILLDSDLGVVADGVEEGRRTFANILKYVRMGASSNFGNMLSMAAASLFLPFLPMLPTQILLNNLLYDVSEIGIPFDGVRPEAVARPQVWDMRALIRFAAVMGPLSSVFDLLTFAGLSLVFHVAPPEFRTAWFLESMATQILVIFIIRTNGRPWADLPRPALAASSLGALLVALALPFTPVGAWFGFVVPPLTVVASLGAVTIAYLVMAELLKTFLFDHTGRKRHRRSPRRQGR